MSELMSQTAMGVGKTDKEFMELIRKMDRIYRVIESSGNKEVWKKAIDVLKPLAVECLEVG